MSRNENVARINEFSRLAAQAGFTIQVASTDSGVELLLAHAGDTAPRRVQLKGRWTIDRRNLDRDVWVAFPDAGKWYLIPHSVMVSFAKREGVTETASWIENGLYHRPQLSRASVSDYARYQFPGSATSLNTGNPAASSTK